MVKYDSDCIMMMSFIGEFSIFEVSSGCSGRGGDVDYIVLVIIKLEYNEISYFRKIDQLKITLALHDEVNLDCNLSNLLHTKVSMLCVSVCENAASVTCPLAPVSGAAESSVLLLLPTRAVTDTMHDV